MSLLLTREHDRGWVLICLSSPNSIKMTTRPVLTVVIEMVNNSKYGSIKENGQTIIFPQEYEVCCR